MFDTDFLVYGLANIHWHLWVEPDLRLIECLILQLFTIIVFVVGISSLITIVTYITKHKQIPHHWSIPFSLGIILLSIILSLSSFILLVYQQNGRHFDINHIECKVSIGCIILFTILSPIIVYKSITGYFKWRLLLSNKIRKLEENETNIKWFSVKTFSNNSDMDLRHLVAINVKKQIQNNKDETNVLLNEKTNERILNSDDIILTAIKTKYRLHLLSFIAQLILFITTQYKNYYEEQHKLLIWGDKFSKLINEDDYYIAKWELENGIMPDPNETFETIEWMQHIARTNMHKKR